MLLITFSTYLFESKHCLCNEDLMSMRKLLLFVPTWLDMEPNRD